MSYFDLSMYYPIPLLTTEGYVSLTNTMLDVAPSDPPIHVGVSIKALSEVLGEVETGLVSRIDEDLSTRLERVFDIFVDRCWLESRTRLEFFEIYKSEGADKLSEADRAKLDFDERLDQARTASLILDKLFGEGTDFLRTQFAQQATHMAARLDWIEAKGLEDEFAELVTPELATLLKVCQERYEAMITERNSRDGKSVADLRELRHKLRCQLAAYCGAIGTMYDPGNPESAKVVEAALRPILTVRARSRRKPATGAVEEVSELLEELTELGEGEGETETEAELEGEEPQASEEQLDHETELEN